GHTAYRDKGNDICSSDAWMLAAVPREVDMTHGRFDATNGRCADRFRCACDRNDRAVMAGLHFPAQQVDVTGRSNGLHDGIDHLRPPSFTEIRYALDDS